MNGLVSVYLYAIGTRRSVCIRNEENAVSYRRLLNILLRRMLSIVLKASETLCFIGHGKKKSDDLYCCGNTVATIGLGIKLGGLLMTHCFYYLIPLKLYLVRIAVYSGRLRTL